MSSQVIYRPIFHTCLLIFAYASLVFTLIYASFVIFSIKLYNALALRKPML